MTGRRLREREMSVVVHLVPDPAAEAAVHGEIESPFGTRRFTGWLDLLGQLEALLERSQRAPATPAAKRPPRAP